MHAAILSRRDDSKRWRARPWNDVLDLICLASLAPFRRWSMKIIAQPLRPSHSWTWFFAQKKKQVHPRRGASCLDGKKPTAPPVPKDSHSFRISSVRRKTPRRSGGEGGVCEPADGVCCGERIGGNFSGVGCCSAAACGRCGGRSACWKAPVDNRRMQHYSSEAKPCPYQQIVEAKIAR